MNRKQDLERQERSGNEDSGDLSEEEGEEVKTKIQISDSNGFIYFETTEFAVLMLFHINILVEFQIQQRRSLSLLKCPLNLFTFYYFII